MAGQNTDGVGTANGGTSIKMMTENERWLLVAAFKHLKSKLDVDWDAVAAEPDCPYKNKGSITVTFGRIKRDKLGLGGVVTSNTDTPGSRKKSVGSGTNNTPSRVTKSGGGRKKNGFLPQSNTPVRRNLAAEFENAKMGSDGEEQPAMTTRGRKIKYEPESSEEHHGYDTEDSAGGDPNFLKPEPDSDASEFNVDAY